MKLLNEIQLRNTTHKFECDDLIKKDAKDKQ